MEEQLILIYNSWILDMILWTYSTISQSIANIGDSGDFLDFLNGLVEINPKNKETSVNETADWPIFFCILIHDIAFTCKLATLISSPYPIFYIRFLFHILVPCGPVAMVTFSTLYLDDTYFTCKEKFFLGHS